MTKMISVLAALAALTAPLASGGADRAEYRFRVVASGLAAPTYVTATRSEPQRLYVVEQAGRIRVIENGRVRPEPFLDIRNLVVSGGEQGLLSMAFHPNYARNRKLYVNYTDRNGDTRVVEYRSNGTRVLTRTRRQLLFVGQPYSNHNGGQLQFGPDGRLWVGMGDGGSGGDPENRAQNMRTKLGKLLRRNVDRRGGGWQIVGYGLRNPWRFTFDRARGDLYIGDVGQNAWEEINFRARARIGRLANYGWPLFEGRAPFDRRRPMTRRGALIFPVAVYRNPALGCSVTGGYVYRGSSVRSARGRYFYGDFCSGRVWSFRAGSGRARDLRREPFTVPSVSSFGEDARGELYAASFEGRIYRLTP